MFGHLALQHSWPSRFNNSNSATLVPRGARVFHILRRLRRASRAAHCPSHSAGRTHGLVRPTSLAAPLSRPHFLSPLLLMVSLASEARGLVEPAARGTARPPCVAFASCRGPNPLDACARAKRMVLCISQQVCDRPVTLPKSRATFDPVTRRSPVSGPALSVVRTRFTRKYTSASL